MRPNRATAFTGSGLIGVFGGLIGLGGAEFRIPLLVGVFGLKLRHVVPLNLLTSLITVLAALAMRAAMGRIATLDAHWPEIIALAFGALAGAAWGTRLFHRVADHLLERTVGMLLLALGVLLMTEAWLPETTRIVLPSLLAAKLAAGILLGCIIGVVSSVLGVAGGELIIPTLLFIFGADIATAGTASLVIALPAMVLGILRHHARDAYCDDSVGRNLVPSLALGAIMGAMIGASLVGTVSPIMLKALLGGLLVLSATKLFGLLSPRSSAHGKDNLIP